MASGLRALDRAGTKKRPAPSLFLRRYGAAYIFIAPFFLLYTIFGLYPVFYSFVLSFHDWSGVGSWRWVGATNYEQYVMGDSVFRISIANTVYYWVGLVPGMTLLALVLAVIMNQPRLHLKGIFRTTYMLPYITSVVSIAVIFANLFDDQVGWINFLLVQIGLPRIAWLRSIQWSKVSVILLIVWKWVGYNMVIMLAGLQSISPEIYEMATLDGAGPLRRFVHMTVPLMRPVIMFVFIMSTIGTFNTFAEPYLLTGGGPSYSSTTPAILLYLTAFRYGRFGAASSLSFIMAAMIFAASLLQIRFGTRES
jgi:lactose/L-arabinose transport system permease protein